MSRAFPVRNFTPLTVKPLNGVSDAVTHRPCFLNGGCLGLHVFSIRNEEFEPNDQALKFAAKKTYLLARNQNLAEQCLTYHGQFCERLVASESQGMLTRKIIMKKFITSYFNYCPLTWMFYGRKVNNVINIIRQRALRISYNDYNSTFEALLIKDCATTIHQHQFNACCNRNVRNQTQVLDS